MVVALVAAAGCSSETGTGATPVAPPITTTAAVGPSTSPSASAGTNIPPPTAAPTPMPSAAYPPLSGFGEVHELGSAVAISDAATGTVLSLDRLEYITCPLRAGDPDPCLDGYRTRIIEGERRDFVVAPEVRFTYWEQPEVYLTGGLAKLREFITSQPSIMVLLQLDPTGRVIAVGQPFLP
ncbi:hypothetical protein [Parafrankia sp. FMc2]|uniref:hypothetical protein n=1 Tax=Parafrankia sp. FMc2 TaxID=3233196 RepID=UPI0034D6A5AD